MKELSVRLTPWETIAGWIYYAFQLFVLGLIVGAVNHLLGNPLSNAEMNILCFIINFAAIAVIFRKYLWGNLKTAMAKPGRTIGYALCGFVLYYVCSIVVSIMILMLNPNYANANDTNISGMLQEHTLLMTLCTVVLVPIAEETLYRGLMFGGIYPKNKVLAYVVSMSVFSLIHVVGYIGVYDPGMLVLSFFQYLPAGFFLAWTYVQTDSIVGSTLMHMIINLIAVCVMQAM